MMNSHDESLLELSCDDAGQGGITANDSYEPILGRTIPYQVTQVYSHLKALTAVP